MDINVNVRINGHYFSVAAGVKIPEQYEKCFQPLKTCDEPLMAMVTGEKLSGVEVMRTREDAADVISKELAKILVDEMKKHDTHNGYKSNL
jgi:hypothetical protein